MGFTMLRANLSMGHERMTSMRLVSWLVVPVLLCGCLGRSGNGKDGSEVGGDGRAGGEQASGGADSGAESSAGGVSGSGTGANRDGTSSSGGTGGGTAEHDCPLLTKTVEVFNLGNAEELLELEGVTTLDGDLHVGWVL